MRIGERIRRLRKRLGLTQKEFAGRVAGKVDYTYIGKMERGEQYPSLKMLERIGKAFSVPLSYFFEDDSVLKSLNLLPGEIKDLLKDRKRQDLLTISQELNPRDLGLVMQIINILTQKKPLEGLQLAEPGLAYLSMEEKKRKDLISRIEAVLRGSPRVLSLEEDWLSEALKIALEALKKSSG
jgi:transcriptional regulator with XRE-family HTH domain